MNNTAYALDGQENFLLRAALACAELGWFVLPLHHPIGQRCSCGKDCGKDIGKHPRIKDWPRTATRDPDLITRWWTQWPEANIGILTGAKSGILVVDIDPRNGGDLTVDDLEAEHGKFPPTVESHTGGGGRHLAYQHPGGEVRCGTETLGPGVDIKGDGGYIVAPPSLHASGRRYEWEASSHPNDVPLTPLPAWIPLEDETEEDPETGKRRSLNDYTGDRPGDDYNRRVTREEVRLLLAEHGWPVIEHRDGVDYLRRPGKTSGMYSASLGYLKGNRLKVFTTSDPILQPKKGGYQPFALYALLQHDGDFKAATKALLELGYGRNGQPHEDTDEAEDEPHPTPQPRVVDLPLSDYTNAVRLVDHYGQYLRYSHPAKVWYVWDKTRWLADETATVMRVAKRTIKQMAQEISTIERRRQKQSLVDSHQELALCLPTESHGRTRLVRTSHPYPSQRP
jgi:hypothetical protein